MDTHMDDRWTHNWMIDEQTYGWTDGHIWMIDGHTYGSLDGHTYGWIDGHIWINRWTQFVS